MRYAALCRARNGTREVVQGRVFLIGHPVDGARERPRGNNIPRPPNLKLSTEVVWVRREVLVVKCAALEVRRVLAEALQPLGYRQNAGFAVDHAVPGKIDGILEIEIGKDDVQKAAADLAKG